MNEQDADKLYFEGIKLFEQTKYDEAITCFNQILEENSESDDVLIARAVVFKAMKRLQDALEDCDHAIDLISKDNNNISLTTDEYCEYFCTRGKIKSDLQQYEAAIADFETALEENSDCVDALHARGLAYVHLEEYEAAIFDFDEALNIGGDNTDIIYNRGIANDQLECWLESIQDYTRVISIDPDYILAHLNRGVAYYETKNYPSALQDFQITLNKDPENYLAFSNRAKVKLEMGNYKGALEDCNAALAIDAKHALSLNHKGYALLHLSRYDEALIYFKQAMENKADFQLPLMGCCHIALQRREVNLAQEYWASATKYSDQEKQAMLEALSKEQVTKGIADMSLNPAHANKNLLAQRSLHQCQIFPTRKLNRRIWK